LPQVQQNTTPLLTQEPHTLLQLFAAIATPRAEDIPGKAF
jgi:hypothetical protein